MYQSSYKKAQKAQVISSRIFGLPLRLCAFAREIFFRALLLPAVLLCSLAVTPAQNRLTVSIPKLGELKIEAELSPGRSWSFRNAYADALGIAERIKSFHAYAGSGEEVGLRKIAVGEFRSDRDATRISYSWNLLALPSKGVAHVSWLIDDRGFLKFADLAPIDLQNFTVRFDLPAGWTVESTIAPDTSGDRKVLDPLNSVFFVGNSLRRLSTTVDGMTFDLVLSGKWSFKDADVLKSAGRVLQRYLAITQFKLPERSMIMIAPPPFHAGMDEWWAETRGSTVVLLVEPRGNKLKDHLTILLTHELLHLWVPNSLKLDGDYDWFFEGFTLYMALRMALDVDVIKFKEYLNTLGRAYDSYLSQPDDSSLLEASEKRWTTAGSQVYVKGMLVAFLYDLSVRKESGGRMTLADRYRELFAGNVAEQAQANEVIIRLLGAPPAMADFTKLYIEKAHKLELERLLPAYGLQVAQGGKGSQLRVSRELSAEQKQILRSLGYR